MAVMVLAPDDELVRDAARDVLDARGRVGRVDAWDPFWRSAVVEAEVAWQRLVVMVGTQHKAGLVLRRMIAGGAA